MVAMSKLRRLVGNIFKLALGVIVLSSAGYLWWLHPGYDPIEFSQAAWAEADDETRGHMVDSLRKTHELTGMSESELLGLLGKPDRADYAEGENVEEGVAEIRPLEHARYWIGYQGFRKGAPFVFPYTLHVSLKDGAVTQIWIDD
jgi:hypothetical protein